MANKILFPSDYEPVARPAGRVPISAGEKTILRDAVLAEMAGQPKRYSELLPIMMATVPRLTNDDCVEILDWVMEQWHGADPSLWPTLYIQDEE